MLWQTILTITLIIAALIYLVLKFRRTSSGKESPCEKFCSDCSSCPLAKKCEGDPEKGFNPVLIDDDIIGDKFGDKKNVL